jgi:peptidoglycan/xylan/chitin deacetylase (PgdA/CDA1 family)
LSIVLMYHSTGDVPAGTDLFDLHVGPERFREQIKFLAAHYDILPLADLYRNAASGRPARNCVAISFDDGYANNLSVAAPILRDFGAPATLFLCTGFLDREAYWWDQLAQIVLTATRYPARLADIECGFLGAERLLSETPQLRDHAAPPEAKAAPLRQLVLELWGTLRHLPLDRIYAVLTELDELFGATVDLTAVRPLRAEMVPLAAQAFTIGAHTVTHPFLTTVDDTRLRAEIADSRSVCRRLSGQPVDCFSYPFGDVDPRVEAAVAPHTSLACTVQEGVVGASCHPLRVPRVQAPAWAPDQLGAKLEAVMRAA